VWSPQKRRDKISAAPLWSSRLPSARTDRPRRRIATTTSRRTRLVAKVTVHNQKSREWSLTALQHQPGCRLTRGIPNISHGTPIAYDAAQCSRKSAARNSPQRSPCRTTCSDFTIPQTGPSADRQADLTGVDTLCRAALVGAGAAVPALRRRDKPGSRIREPYVECELVERDRQRSFRLYPWRLGCSHFRMRQFEYA
jgi:hypothetical protein